MTVKDSKFISLESFLALCKPYGFRVLEAPPPKEKLFFLETGELRFLIHENSKTALLFELSSQYDTPPLDFKKKYLFVNPYRCVAQVFKT